MDALNLHLHDGYDCTTTDGDSCTSCIRDIRVCADSVFVDAFPSGVPLISNEMGRDRLSVAEDGHAAGRGPEDEGDDMAWQTLKMLVSGIADSLEYIDWFNLERPFASDCRLAFFDIDGTSSDCPRALDPAWPDSPGVGQPHNPRWSYYAYQNVARVVDWGAQPAPPHHYSFFSSARHGHVERYGFRASGGGGAPVQDLYYMWLHERAPADAGEGIAVPYPTNNIVGYKLRDYRGALLDSAGTDTLHIGQDSMSVTVSYEPLIQTWVVADTFHIRDDPGTTSAWTVEKGTSWEFKSFAVVDSDTVDVTPWATIEKVSEDPNNHPPATSLYKDILTATFGDQDTCSVILRMTWNNVTRDSMFMQLTRDPCTLLGSQDSVRITPADSVSCNAPWVPFAAQATAYSHVTGTVYSCNMTASGTTTWASTDTTVAKVDSLGRVTPVGDGACSVVVTTGPSLRDTLAVTVSQ